MHFDSLHASLSEVFLGSLTKGGANPSCPWAVTLSLNGKPTLFEMDTGADVTVISHRIYEEIGKFFPQSTTEDPAEPLQPSATSERAVHRQVLPRE